MAQLPAQARMRFTITTGSDWSGVYVTGDVAGHEVVAKSAEGIAMSRRGNGFVLTGVPISGAKVVVEAVVQESPGAEQVSFVVQKGWRGQSRVEVHNQTTGQFVLDATNSVRSSTDPRNSATWVRSAEAVFGAQTTRLPHADPRRLVLAFYYPWFSYASYRDQSLADRPLVPRSAWSATDVAAQVRQAKSNGVDGFVVSWSGEQHDGVQLGHVLRASERTGSKVTAYLETSIANARRSASAATDPAVVERWLREALDHSGSSAFLRSDGVPVVFVFDMGRLGAARWQTILDELAAEGMPVRLVGDTNGPGYGAVAWGYHRYDVNLAQGKPVEPTAIAAWNLRAALNLRADGRLFAATVSPGFDNRALRGPDRPVVERGDGERYAELWRAALPSDPDWVLVTSWNEWYENTQIEPGVETGTKALSQTRDWSADYRRTTRTGYPDR